MNFKKFFSTSPCFPALAWTAYKVIEEGDNVKNLEMLKDVSVKLGKVIEGWKPMVDDMLHEREKDEASDFFEEIEEEEEDCIVLKVLWEGLQAMERVDIEAREVHLKEMREIIEQLKAMKKKYEHLLREQ